MPGPDTHQTVTVRWEEASVRIAEMLKEETNDALRDCVMSLVDKLEKCGSAAAVTGVLSGIYHAKRYCI